MQRKQFMPLKGLYHVSSDNFGSHSKLLKSSIEDPTGQVIAIPLFKMVDLFLAQCTTHWLEAIWFA